MQRRARFQSEMEKDEEDEDHGRGDVADAESGARPPVEVGKALSHHDIGFDDFYDPNIDKEAAISGVLEDDSPYPEVRSAVANMDDVTLPASTIRSWTLGVLWSIILPALNQFFFYRYPSVYITGIVAQLLVFPMGRLWAAVIPNWTILGLPLNPGPFSIKEHVVVTIMASVGVYGVYATDIVAVQRFFFNQRWNWIYNWMVVLSTQMIGFSIGGIARRFLVQPPSMIWPEKLVTCALFNTLHSQTYAGIGDRGGISRERFFLYTWLAGACWYIFPGYLFKALSYFSWVCWIVPDNVPVNQMFGYVHGMGMSIITLDWAQIAYTGSPLATPWWAEVNITVGFVFFFWIVTPILYYTNTWYSKYMPISSRGSFDNTGQPYNVSNILDGELRFDQAKYEAYSPVFVSTTFAVSYGLSFAAITATLTHAFLYFRKQIWRQSRISIHEQLDVHARLMSKYQQVPEWWYAVLFLSQFVMGIIAIKCFPTQLPVEWFILALVIAFVYIVPIGIIQATTNQQVGLSVITELIIGYGLPGRPIATVLFKTWGYSAMAQALRFTSDFKLGHYMKVPPRTMFLCQVVATVIGCTTQLGVQSWMFDNIIDICSPNQKDGFVCPTTEVTGTSAIIWGAIGPARQFSKGNIYFSLVFFFLIGFICPIVAYLLSLKYPKSIFRFANFPIIFDGVGWIPPATAVNFIPWAIVGFIFQYVMRRRHFSWWAKYNYVLSAAMDSGVAVAGVLIFFCLQYPRNGAIGAKSIQTWWGNTVPFNNADARGTPFVGLDKGQTFGPLTWS